MSAEASSHRRSFWLGISPFLIIGALLLALLYVASRPPAFHSDPDLIRPWADAWYRNVFDPAMRSKPPSLSALPPPALKTEGLASSPDQPKEVSFTFSVPELPSRNTLYELLPADSSGVVTLPGGTSVTLEAVAVMLPSGDGGGKAIPEWTDAATGLPLASKNERAWKTPWPVPTGAPRLFLKFNITGGESARFDWPAIHDDRTWQSLAIISPQSTPNRDGQLFVDLKTWHQTPLKIGLAVAFGKPVYQTLPLEIGKSVNFGDDAMVKVVEILPHGHWKTFSQGGFMSFSLPDTPPKQPEKSFVLQLWPSVNYRQIEFRSDASSPFRTALTTYGLFAMKLSGEKTEVSEIEVRRYPRMGLAVFQLPRIPKLPEVDDLFDAPIPWIRFERPYQLIKSGAEAAGIRVGTGLYTESSGQTKFPLTLNDTTPRELLRKYEEISGKPIYFSRDAVEISGEKPPGLSERIKAWWEKNKPGWLP